VEVRHVMILAEIADCIGFLCSGRMRSRHLMKSMCCISSISGQPS
jgi:hypothetical protein